MRLVMPAVFLIFLICCSEEKKQKEKNETSLDGSKIVKSSYPNGKTKAEVVYKDGKKNGISRSYDKEGNLTLELPYVNDKKEGRSKKYYAGGQQVYQTTEYKENLMHGIQTKYRDNGDLMSEARYENNFPCEGIKEYYTDKTLKKEYPKIIVTPIDQLDTKGVYILEISMSEKVKGVKFYTGKLRAGCVYQELYNIFLDESTNKGRLRFDLPPGGFKMEEINIIAAVETIYGNTYVTQRAYNLAIDN
jgi:antitoxin component YwqK of YwqJK toxin-antitoxin module